MQYQGGVSGLYYHVTSLIVGDLSPPGGHQQLLRVPGHHGTLGLLHLRVTSVSTYYYLNKMNYCISVIVHGSYAYSRTLI